MGLFDVHDDDFLWPLKMPLPAYLQQANLSQHSHYNCYNFIPGIRERKNIFDYDSVLVLRLDHYIEQSLKFQRSLTQDARIKRTDATQATNEEIDWAVAVLNKYRKSIENHSKSLFSTNTIRYGFFTATLATAAWACNRTTLALSSAVGASNPPLFYRE